MSDDEQPRQPMPRAWREEFEGPGYFDAIAGVVKVSRP
jgi:hypothetical protein